MGVRKEHWSLGLVRRYDHDLRFTKSSSELYWLTSNQSPLPVGKQYDVNVEFNGFNASGVRFSFFDTLKGVFRYSLGLSVLSAEYMIDGVLQGEAAVVSAVDFNYDATIDYHYTDDFLFDRTVKKPVGEGFSVDGFLSYDINQATNVEIHVRDLLGEISWRK